MITIDDLKIWNPADRVMPPAGSVVVMVFDHGVQVGVIEGADCYVVKYWPDRDGYEKTGPLRYWLELPEESSLKERFSEIAARFR